MHARVSAWRWSYIARSRVPIAGTSGLIAQPVRAESSRAVVACRFIMIPLPVNLGEITLPVAGGQKLLQRLTSIFSFSFSLNIKRLRREYEGSGDVDQDVVGETGVR